MRVFLFWWGGEVKGVFWGGVWRRKGYGLEGGGEKKRGLLRGVGGGEEGIG